VRVDITSARQLLERGRVSEAEAAFKELTRHPTERAAALYGLGYIKLLQKDYGSAQVFFEESLKVDARNSNSLYYLGDIAIRRGDRERAIVMFSKVLTLDPRHVGALRRLSDLGNEARAPMTDAPGSVGPRRDAVPGSSHDTSVKGQQPAMASAPATQSPKPEPIRPPRAPSSNRSIVGIARNVRRQVVPWRGKPAANQLLSFRLEVVAKDGSRGPMISIQMQNFEILGNVEEGDWIELNEPFKDGNRVKSFINLTTGERVISKRKIFMAQ
jgi:tetratricopeptide (TPR) repeat protein